MVKEAGRTTKSKMPAVVLLTVLVLVGNTTPAYAMHISEGILPLPWAGLWYLVALPFVIKGISEVRKRSIKTPGFVPLVGMVSAAVFIISAMPIPVPMAGTCSHPAGTGLAAILIGPFATAVSASIALLIQALFLAHGGLTTWGANVVSMGIVGSFFGYATFKMLARLRLPLTLAAFLAGLLSDWATYTMTAIELSLGFHGKESFLDLFKAIFIAFIPTQIPVGILEGFAAASLFAFILKRRPDIFTNLGVVSGNDPLVKDELNEEPAY